MYIGPETLMPLASILAAVTGFVMLFWKKTVGLAKAGVGLVSRTFGRLFSRS